MFSQPSSFDLSGNITSAVTMTLSPKTVKDDLELPRHVGSNVLNALFGVPAPGSANGGFSTRELIGETGINVRDQTAKQPDRNTPIFPCFVYSQDNKHSWDYDAKSKGWQQVR